MTVSHELRFAKRKLDTFLNWSSNCLWRIYARLHGASLARDVEFRGCPLIHCVRGADISFKSGVRINSKLRSNPIMNRARSTFCCVASGARINIGRDVGMSAVSITAARKVSIGEGTLIGADCLISDTDFHIPLPNNRWGNDTVARSAPVVIGKGCFIGARVIILKGVQIGDGVVIAAGAVVTRDVPEAHLASGNPATFRPLPSKWRHPATDAKPSTIG